MVLSATVLVSCASSGASRFYQLQPLVQGASGQQPAAAGQSIVVGVGPVSIPDYLDRPQIVTRTVGNELRLAESHRWAESLQDNVTRVITENLSHLLPADYVIALPWAGASRLKYQVTVKVVQFDGTAAGRVHLRADWSILDGTSGKVLLMRKSNIRVTAASPGYEPLVAAESQAIAEFSRQIATAFKTL